MLEVRSEKSGERWQKKWVGYFGEKVVLCLAEEKIKLKKKERERERERERKVNGTVCLSVEREREREMTAISNRWLD
jgi:uncharacterized protein YueI